MIHSVKTTYNGGMAFSSDINAHKVKMDTIPDEGGADTGPSPKRLMLASLAGCTGMDVVTILHKMKVEFSDLSIDVRATLTKEHPQIYDHVKISYTIKMQETDKPKMEKAVTLSQEKYCGVSAMFRAFSKLETLIIYL